MSDVNTKHRKYEQKIFARKLVRDSIAGSDAIKRNNELYLPMPDGMRDDNTAVSSQNMSKGGRLKEGNFEDIQLAPYYHSNPAYRAYLQRARFPDITLYTLRGLVGTATRKPLTIEKLPSSVKHLEENATFDGMSLDDLFAECVEHVLKAGNVSLVLDIDVESNLPLISIYSSETTINWRRFALQENYELTVFSYKEERQGKDIFETEEKTITLAYTWDEVKDKDGNVVSSEIHPMQSLYVDSTLEKSVTPTLQGKPFAELPVVFIGSVKNEPEPQPIPLYGVAEIAHAIYRKDADLSQAQYMTCNPNLVVTGHSSNDGIPSVVGSTIAMLIPEPDAKVFYPSTDTSALDHVKETKRELMEEAMLYGASLIGSSKQAAEKVETVKLRQSAQGATLISIVRNVVDGIEKMVRMAAGLSNDDEQVVITASTDFSERQLSPQMISALISAWASEGLSQMTLLELFEDAGMLGEGRTADDELKRILEEDFGEDEVDQDKKVQEEETEE